MRDDMLALMKKPNEVAALVEVEDIIASPDENHLLLEVLMVALCRTDLYVASGIIKKTEDIVLGHEFVARVIDDPKGLLTGQTVCVNPLYPSRQFMGLDFNGALVEKIVVPRNQVVQANSVSLKAGAYTEPLAASLAILNAKPVGKGAIYGANRIAQLTYVIAKCAGLDVELLDEVKLKEDIKSGTYVVSETYDYIVETIFAAEDILLMMKLLKDNGKLIVKSRKKEPVAIDASLMVAKNLTFQATNYYDFQESMNWLEKNTDKIDFLLGEDYPLEKWEEAFEAAYKSESKKIFISVAKI